MTWIKFQRLLIDAAIWAWLHWYLIAGVVALVLVLYVIGFVNSCNDRREEKKVEQIKEKVIEGKIESNIAANEVKNAENNSNIAGNNYNNLQRTDSNKYSGANADERFCRRYPNDSSCAGRLQSTP